MAKPQYQGPWKRLRLQVLERDEYECQIKGPHCTHLATEVDHIQRVTDNGAWWDLSNLRAACFNDNRGRRRPPPPTPSRVW